ncbi:DUF7551 domain-containing protein [Halobellus rufus]|uniref:DUF7551 domain-containing protein n=1 Tax=Halobellus rufus TaxID=1448860 RepID=UPI000679D7A3|nr:hypothetical protein [Halobellus rufus]
MVGATLRDISQHVDCLAAPGGPYAVVCGRTGCEPYPVSGRRFDDRDTAAEAAEAATEYRATLRQYDPQVPFYEPLVHDLEDGPTGAASSPEVDPRVRYLRFCHTVAGATFEALNAASLREVESAAMETYLTLAEVVEDRDDFCLTLLWSVTSELAHRADRRERADVVTATARALRGPDATATLSPDEALRAAIEELADVGFVAADSVAVGAGPERWRVTFGDYALAERTGRLPTLPISVTLGQYLPGTDFAFTAATPVDGDRWQLTLELDEPPAGLVSVDATDEGQLYATPSQY